MADIRKEAEKLVEASKQKKSLVKFIENGSLNRLFSYIKDDISKDAEKALSLVKNSSNKQETIRYTATLLKLALAKYEDKLSGRIFNKIVQMKSQSTTLIKYYITAMALVSCYIYLNENHAVKEVLEAISDREQWKTDALTIPDVIATKVAAPIIVALNPFKAQAEDEMYKADDVDTIFDDFKTNIEVLLEKNDNQLGEDDDVTNMVNKTITNIFKSIKPDEE